MMLVFLRKPQNYTIPMNSLHKSLKNGVRFRCTDCGACCTGAPGRVRISEEELEAVSEFRNESLSALRNRVTYEQQGTLLLKERDNGDCVFFEDGRCSIHPVKPTQCRLYPFWFQNVRNEEAWRKTCAECPGIGQGDWISPDEIIRQVTEDLDSGGSTK
jgi:Fe-S-cluster containining protein